MLYVTIHMELHTEGNQYILDSIPYKIVNIFPRDYIYTKHVLHAVQIYWV